MQKLPVIESWLRASEGPLDPETSGGYTVRAESEPNRGAESAELGQPLLCHCVSYL